MADWDEGNKEVFVNWVVPPGGIVHVGGAGGGGRPLGTSTRIVPWPSSLPDTVRIPRLDMKTSISVQVTLDNEYRPHSIGKDPAVIYADGRKEYYVKGVRVPEYVVTQPERIKIDDINKETNTEVRRIMMERYGNAKYLQNSKAVLIDEDEFGKLWRVDVPLDEPLMMVEVLNSTPEPDGTIKTYWLRVPPTVRTPQEAIAWTFSLDPKSYDPVLQT